MKRLMLTCPLLLICIAATFYLASGNTPQINRSDLLLWRITPVWAGICMTACHHIVRQSAVSC